MNNYQKTFSRRISRYEQRKRIRFVKRMAKALAPVIIALIGAYLIVKVV